jgi:hypothetical protein
VIVGSVARNYSVNTLLNFKLSVHSQLRVQTRPAGHRINQCVCVCVCVCVCIHSSITNEPIYICTHTYTIWICLSKVFNIKLSYMRVCICFICIYIHTHTHIYNTLSICICYISIHICIPASQNPQQSTVGFWGFSKRVS